MNPRFWFGKRVLITGHTGFKGSWLSLWLQRAGATLLGYGLPPADGPSLFKLASVGSGMESVYADIRDLDTLQAAVEDFEPEIVLHLAAQPLVRVSYADPVTTYSVNVLGTVHVLEAVRRTRSCRVVVNITSDKCYENTERQWAYREGDPLGGHDPYSSSKGCAELVTSAYRRSFFQAQSGRCVAIASARAGNVIGGGDFAQDRLVPDVMMAIQRHTRPCIRYPDAIRPWQHVLEPLSGYLLLAERLWDDPQRFSQSWNFGPAAADARSVRWIVDTLSDLYGTRMQWEVDAGVKPHEAGLLMLDSSKARAALGWQPRWTLERALRSVVHWHQAYERGEPIHRIVMDEIAAYEAAGSVANAPLHSVHPECGAVCAVN